VPSAAPWGTEGVARARTRTAQIAGISSLLLASMWQLAWSQPNEPARAQALRARYDSLQESLQHNSFKQPLTIQSTQSDHVLQGDIYAVVNYSYPEVIAELTSPVHWCDIIILHINTKHCQVAPTGTGADLQVFVGRKVREDLAKTSRIDFSYRVRESGRTYTEFALDAASGPMGTTDYRITLEAIPLQPSKAFIHLAYSYSIGFSARMAMQTYLSTIGRDKVGFTETGKSVDGTPVHIAGVRAMVERNTMRYYLAIVAFLESARFDPASQLERRLNQWFSATEQYPLQLHEMDQKAYLEMKRAETAAQ
jgi:hypothetical protein